MSHSLYPSIYYRRRFLLTVASSTFFVTLAQAQNAVEETPVVPPPSASSSLGQMYQGFLNLVASAPWHWAITALLMFSSSYLLGWLTFIVFFNGGKSATWAARCGAIVFVWLASLLWCAVLVPVVWKIAPPLWFWVIGLLSLVVLSFAIYKNNPSVRN